MSSAADLRAVALAEFATAGYTGTSLARIAEKAGLAKSSVLYHYASKEVLLEAAVTPAIDRLDAILDDMARAPFTSEARAAFVERFVDFLLEHRLEVHLFINQGMSLVDVPVMLRANALVVRIADFFANSTSSIEERMRFGIALGGAAYLLVSQQAFDVKTPIDETRDALVTILSELLAPIRA
ncbi:TetR/AcrR family transcriptional regulator [Salinibacterium hongtaonis]|uniref:TetR/AcrR family transcriptional regulator n=1 Tax=Homoserinimonas hongtaonis TaxID=2079791 RepID=A0A2U1SX28_9MICO|nr:TetR/AcrR family transcriptional regulator [Salinibacterium hongtaonis]AWB88693.1 TetR family transcriptional regulator [Salinibacterium hongtaonis]PWB96103.1 TetR/AcrR family transcriptional regulator [Salinibacterium hongtaonis]